MFPKEVEITDRHKKIIYTCMGAAKGRLELAHECGFDAGVIKDLEPIVFPGLKPRARTLSWRVWAAIVDYARKQEIVSEFFDVITCQEPYASDDIDVQNAVSMMCILSSDERKRLYDEICRAYWRHLSDGWAGSDGDGTGTRGIEDLFYPPRRY